MKQKNKKNNYKLGSYVIPKYANGGFAKFAGSDTSSLGAPIGAATNMLGSAIGGTTGSTLSSAGSLAAAGASLGPLGIAGGAILGAGIGLLGANKQKKAERAARNQAYTNMSEAYVDQFNSNLDIDNQNPYGVLEYADGGPIKPKKPVYAPIPAGLDWIHQDYTTNKGTMVTDAQYRAYKDQGLDFGNTKNLGLWLDSWGGNAKPADKVQPSGREGMKYEFDDPMYSTRRFANGGEVPIDLINIEKGELQIDPESGKIIREYTGINPETGGLYKPHSKGKDPKDNFVTAEPGTFIITTKEAKKYKDAIDNNDKLHQNTILQNIKNYKDSVTPKAKMADGGDVPPFIGAPSYGYSNFMNTLNTGINPAPPRSLALPFNKSYTAPNLSNNIKTTGLTPGGGAMRSNSNFLGNATNFLTNYGPSLLNIGQGLFGNVNQQPNVAPITNPYKVNILSNMPQDINFEPIRQQVLRQRNTNLAQIDNSTSSSPIARANKQNVFANTQNTLGKLFMDNQIQNNQIRGQRASIYQGLGSQDMASQDRAQQINLGINESNLANRAAKSNLLSTGLSQLQQTYQNDRLNNRRASLDNYKVNLLREMFPNLKYYGDQFGDDALAKLIG